MATATGRLHHALCRIVPGLLASLALLPCAAGAATPPAADAIGRASLTLHAWAPHIAAAATTLQRMLDGSAPPGSRLALLQLVAWLEIACGAPDDAAVAWSRVQAEAERRGDDRRAHAARQQQAEFAMILGRYPQVEAQVRHLLDYAQATADGGFRASATDYAAVLARRRGDLQRAAQLQQQALALRRERADPAAIERSLTNLGMVRRDQGDFAGALALYLEAMHLGETRDDGVDAGTYRSIALLYREVDDREQADAFFRRALDAERARPDPISLASTLGSYAVLLNDRGEAERALTMARQALALDTMLGNRPHVGLERVQIARALIGLGRVDEAQAEVREALALGDALRQHEILGSALLLQGTLDHRAGRLDAAAAELDRAIGLLDAARLMPPLIEACRLRSALAEARGDYRLALVFERRYDELRQDLLGVRSGQRLATLRARYESDAAAQRIRVLTLDNEVKALKLREQALVRNLSLLGALLLALLALALAGRYRATRRLHRDLALKHAEVERQRGTLSAANAQLSAQATELYQAAISDALTGVYNRGHVLRQAELQIARRIRDGGEFSVLMIDFDHFKRINDEHGHLFGDTVLTAGTQAVRQWLEPGDLLGRLGGEEFLVVLDGRDEAAALALAERLRGHVAAALARFAPSGTAYTISIGVASLRTCDAPNLRGLLGAADAAVYSAKTAGRNRVAAARYARN
ncbi:MAG: diguanylate cyclase [Mizugakiibacter sp.]|uniref:diguanylate cyclase n=1 Tax=Mizugakiibacter sp. TaxID=1972610 RepID=UPI0031C7E705|nr:diguanylate cyclase [Xanthomonadaceae bacterium]